MIASPSSIVITQVQYKALRLTYISSLFCAMLSPVTIKTNWLENKLKMLWIPRISMKYFHFKVIARSYCHCHDVNADQRMIPSITDWKKTVRKATGRRKQNAESLENKLTRRPHGADWLPKAVITPKSSSRFQLGGAFIDISRSQRVTWHANVNLKVLVIILLQLCTIFKNVVCMVKY